MSTARFRLPGGLAAPPTTSLEDSGSHPTDSRARQSQPVKITLAEDPVETYLASRKTTTGRAAEERDWVPILKWVALIFLLLQLFWWLAPSLSRVNLKS